MKVMLAATLNDIKSLRLPMLASPKLDGVRAVVVDNVVYSRNMKPIPNALVQGTWGRRMYDGLDGELIVGDPTAPDCYRATMSGVMAAAGSPSVNFYAFDLVLADYGLQSRLDYLYKKRLPNVRLLKHTTMYDVNQIAAYETLCLAEGYEGIMLRAPHGEYKHGRSTMIEQGLVKVKQFNDAEAEVVGYEEKMHNGNEAKADELGRTKRSSHKANKIGKGTLGALVCRSKEGVIFNIGTGFSDQLASELWAVRDSLVGRSVTYKFFPSGNKQAPRFPVFKGFRLDL